ncbi:MAG: sodium:calcium antiporter, partial [Parabacteroides distasonis]
QDLVVGNIIGSNLFNICVVLGIPVAIFGTITPVGFQMLDIIMLVASEAMLFIFASSTKKINRVEGIIMLATFAVYYGVIMLV